MSCTTVAVPTETSEKPPLEAPVPSWIWCGDTEEHRHVWAWARRTFFVEEEGEPAWLEISADLRYMAWLNGRRVGFGPPKFHAANPTLDRHDISGWLRRGDNVLAVQVYSLGPEKISSCSPQRGALWVNLQTGCRRVVSNSEWKMRRDPGYHATDFATRHTQPPNEHYDAGLGLFRPWDERYDDSDWPSARRHPASAPAGEMEARDIPFMASECHSPDRMIESGIAQFPLPIKEYPLSHFAEAMNRAELRPDRTGCLRYATGDFGSTPCEARADRLASHEAAYFIWDLGRVWSGYPVLHATGSPGTVLDISYGEHLINGRVNPAKSRMHYFDRAILGSRPLEYRVTWPKSARFIQVLVHGGTAAIHRLEWERSTYPITRRGGFSSDSAAFDQAVEISLHTAQLCMEDSYMDTPWRERGSWLGDDLVKAQIAADYFQDYALARRFLLHHARGQRENGMLRGKYPGNVTSNVSTWTLRFPPSLVEYCSASGDWDLARELWPTLIRLHSWLMSLQTAHFLFQAPPAAVTEHSNHYNFIDWAPIDLRGVNAAWNAFAFEALRCIEAIARQLGHAARAREISGTRDALRSAFQEHFWDERRGVFVNGVVEGKQTERWGCHENYLALLYGLASEVQSARIAEQLRREDLFTTFEAELENCEAVLPGLGKIPTVSLALSQYRWPASRMVPLGTPYFAGYMIDALCEAGMTNDAMRFIEKHWGEFSRQGATTVWETWNSEQSLSHGWSAIPAIFATRTLLGVRRADVAGLTWHILPAIECLKSFRGRVATRFGVVQVEWTGDTLSVDVPAGATFLAGLPARSGASLWVNEERANNAITLKKGVTPYLATVVPPGKTSIRLE